MTKQNKTVDTSHIYQVRYLPKVSIEIDGLLNEDVWSQANCLTGFSFPWRDRPAPLTKFYALCDEDYFYFAYDVEDADIVLQEPFGSKMDIATEDRVEIFFTANIDLKKYWGLEIDPLGRLLDYQVQYHRQFDFNWSCPEITTAGKIHKTGYTVEGKIALNTFRQLGLDDFKPGNQLHFGLYRGEFSHLKNGDIEEAWMSWIDPNVPEPDFHVPTSFGMFQIVE